MLDALLATIGTLGVLASLLVKRGRARTDVDADADAGANADACEPAAEDERPDAAPSRQGRRRGCPHRRVRPRTAKGTGQ